MSPESPNTLMATLREAIDEIHTRFESLPFFEALQSGALPLECYVGQLRTLASIHATLEHELALVAQVEIRTIILDQPSRLNHLRQDLAFFDQQHIPDIEAVLTQTRIIAKKDSQTAGGAPGRAAGRIVCIAGKHARSPGFAAESAIGFR